MWLTLTLAILASLVVLYVPGYFVGRAFRLDHASSTLVAPAFSLVIFAVLGIIALLVVDVQRLDRKGK